MYKVLPKLRPLAGADEEGGLPVDPGRGRGAANAPRARACMRLGDNRAPRREREHAAAAAIVRAPTSRVATWKPSLAAKQRARPH